MCVLFLFQHKGAAVFQQLHFQICAHVQNARMRGSAVSRSQRCLRRQPGTVMCKAVVSRSKLSQVVSFGAAWGASIPSHLAPYVLCSYTSLLVAGVAVHRAAPVAPAPLRPLL